MRRKPVVDKDRRFRRAISIHNLQVERDKRVH